MTTPSRTASRRSGLAVLAVLTVSLVLTGCGGGGRATVAPPRPADVVRQAYAATRDAGTAQVDVLSRTTAAGQPLDVTGDGVLDLAHGSADLGLDLPSLGGRVRVLFVGGVVYAALPPPIAGFVGGGRPWVSIDLDRVAQSPYGTTLAQLSGGVTGNPTQELGYLQGVRDDARLVGPETIDGTPTTHYAATIDLDRVPAAQDPAARPALDRLKAQLGTSTLPVDVWVDPQGRLRRVTQTVAPPPRPNTPPTSATTTVTFAQFGVPVSITAPAPDQVTDVGRLIPGQ